MNGIHDMGGMDGFGPIESEENEPVFHETWEGRVYALFFYGLRPWFRGRDIPHLRFALESIRPDEYLRMSYYERWYEAIKNNLLKAGLVSEHELETGCRDLDRQLPTLITPPENNDPTAPAPAPAFSVDDVVRVRNVHPRGHSRVPRYVRGKQGTILKNNGIWALPDTDENGQRLGNSLQHVYTVRFNSQKLWGERASSRDFVYIDLWEEYIEST